MCQLIDKALEVNKTTNPDRIKSTTDYHTQTRLGQNEKPKLLTQEDKLILLVTNNLGSTGETYRV